jgi:hypothetical protein
VIGRLLLDDDAVKSSQIAAKARAASHFGWLDVLTAYEHELIALSRGTQATRKQNFSRATSGNP